MSPTPTAPPRSFRVALLGFTEFERSALRSFFRLAEQRDPVYVPAPNLSDADFLVADAEHPPSVQLVLVTERQAQTVFIGAPAPAGAIAWMARPIDPLHVLRELDAMVCAIPASPLAEAVQQAVVAGAAAPAPTDALPHASAEDSRAPVPATPTSAAVPPPDSPARPPPQPIQPFQAAGPPPALPPGRRQEAPPAPLRALLVDDSEIAQRFLETRLQPWGLLTERAASSGAALEMLGERSFDLVFLDVELGPASELDGLGLCQAIKQSPASMHSVVTMVSAHHSELDRARGALAGCDAFLAKPLDGLELARLLQRHGLKAPAV